MRALALAAYLLLLAVVARGGSSRNPARNYNTTWRQMKSHYRSKKGLPTRLGLDQHWGYNDHYPKVHPIVLPPRENNKVSEDEDVAIKSILPSLRSAVQGISDKTTMLSKVARLEAQKRMISMSSFQNAVSASGGLMMTDGLGDKPQ